MPPPTACRAGRNCRPIFLSGNTAIIQHTTGNLANVREYKATFPFGVAGLAGKNSPHTVVGGGNLHFFKHANQDERHASLRFARWITAPDPGRAMVDPHRLHRHLAGRMTTRPT